VIGLDPAAYGTLTMRRTNASLIYRLEGIKYWDGHAGFGYAGPQDVDLLDH
jgi:hypothetical protein